MKFNHLTKITISAVLIISAITTTYLASYYIHKTFNIPPVVKDLLWEKLPYFNVLWLSEVFLIISVICLLVWAFKKDVNYIYYSIILFSSFHLIRAFLIILTPLGFPNEYAGFIQSGTESIYTFGAFPSGHLSIPLISFLITKNKLFLIFTIIIGILLILSESHYSIDLVGTLLLAYPIVVLGNKYLKKYYMKNEK